MNHTLRSLYIFHRNSCVLFLIGGFLFSGPLSSTTRAQDDDARARKIVSQMTLDEKIDQMHGTSNKQVHRIVLGLPRLGIPDLLVTNGPAGFGPAGPGHSGHATALPAPISLAATWDLDAARQYGVIAASESADFGNTLLEAPDINIARIPQNGRTFEAFGEDPFLVGKLAVANIIGIQSQGIIANVKHYAANNQEDHRHSVDAVVDERTLREIYLPAFEASIKEGKSASIMGAYNKVNGHFCCENAVLLNNILKKDWGFEGFVTSDFGAVDSTADSVINGLDLEMPDGKFLGEPLKAAVANGKVTVGEIDEHLIRRFRTMMRVGVWDHPPERKKIPAAENGAISRQIAEKGCVLLRNNGGLLPLNATTIKSVLLIGPDVVKAYTGGGGSSKVTPVYTVSPMEGFQKRLGAGVKITTLDGKDTAVAAKAARESDAVILMVGDHQGEGRDHAVSLGAQDVLVEAVVAANKRTIVVVASGGPVLMPWADHVPAIVQIWYAGEEVGPTIAAMVFGDFNPSGKLPITFAKAVADFPASTPEQYPGVGPNKQFVEHYSEGVLVGYRWYDAKKIEPLFPFGFGLSYTTFEYKNLKLSDTKLTGASPTLTVDFDIANTGKRDGAEVAQVYVGIPSLPDVMQPPRQLKGFAKLDIATGKTVHAQITLDGRAFSYWDVSIHAWKIAPGDYTIDVGSSSRDIRLSDRVHLQ